MDRSRTWARATVIAATTELRSGAPGTGSRAADEVWLRRRLDKLGRE